MTQICNRASDIDIVDYLEDPSRPEWEEFHRHIEACVSCAEEVSSLEATEVMLRATDLDDPSLHPPAADLARRMQLPAPAQREIEDHLHRCERCRRTVTFVETFDFSRLDALRLKQEVVDEQVAAQSLRQPERASRAPAPLTALWREATGAAKEHVYELTSRLVIELRNVAAVFSEFPAGMVPVPYVPHASTRRGTPGDAPPVSIVALGQSIPIPLPDPGLSAQVSAERQDTGHLRLRVTLQGNFRGPVAVSLREHLGTRSRLISAQSTESLEPFTVEDLTPGEYSLEVWEIESQRRFQVPLPVISGPSQ